MRYSNKLREFANWLDAHPELADKISDRYERPTMWVSATDWEDFQETISHLGSYKKDGYGGHLEATHVQKDQDDETIFQFRVSVANVCEATPKVDEDGQPVLKKKQRYVETDEYEQEMEWKCPDVWSK